MKTLLPITSSIRCPDRRKETRNSIATTTTTTKAEGKNIGNRENISLTSEIYGINLRIKLIYAL